MSNGTSDRKPSSPLKDSLRLLFHNKPAVLSLFMIVLLASAAISGQLMVGKRPTDDQIKLMDKAAITGDTLAIEVKRGAVLDHTKTELKDTFLPPLSESRHIEGKIYFLGTDDLGRDVLARLWAGSTISLTIGFLAVGISVLLGITLGGIAGYFGRSRVRLPLLAMLLLGGGGGVLWAAEFEYAAIPVLAIAAGFFVVQAVMALLGKRFGSVIVFGVVLMLSLSIRAYNSSVESSTPEGRVYNSASMVADESYMLVRQIRDLGAEVKLIEDSDPRAKDSEWRLTAQLEIENKQAALNLLLSQHALLVHETQLEIIERGLGEREERIAHLESLDLAEDAAMEKNILEGDRKRLDTLKAKTEELSKDVTAKEMAVAAAAEKTTDKLEPLGSNALLERRAELRKAVVDKFRAERDNRFETLVKGKNLDGTTRYGAYRVLRHFITTVVLYILLLVTALLVAAQAQAAAGESRSIVSKLFIPTITVDDLVMRFTEIMLTIPVLFLILMVLALFERDVYIVMAVIGLTSWMGTTRFVRAEILSLREQDFVQAARSLGVSDFRIIWRHLVPNAISPVLVSATIGVAGAVLAESTLSFLGIGAGENQDTWGKILADGRLFLNDAPWLTWIPGIAILITVLSFNLLGEGLREAFNPKLRGR
ncbi:MAG: ABC transporter permease subunit [Planctomycetes bacterium]|nr:ABC transporter permease subunit [Planctomycetota bacterium]